MTKRKEPETVIEVAEVTKVFPAAGGVAGNTHVLRGVSMTVKKGQIVAVVGASGAGKSTLLHIMGTLDRPTSGKVYFGDLDVFSLDDDRLARFRNRHIGFVFQFHHLLPEFSALENVAMPSLIMGRRYNEVEREARSRLESVGLGNKLHNKPAQLSGGEQQRVAVARALMNSPQVVLADEPSGNLDTASAQSLHKLMWDLSADHGQTFVIVTHNEGLASEADKIVKIVDGVVQGGRVGS